jgi:hypothetical protein
MRYEGCSKGEWIRDYLEEHGEAYVYELHKAFAEWCEDHDYDPPGYKSMRRTVYLLERSGVVRRTRQEPSDTNTTDRQYYEIVPGESGAEAWESPQRAVYG